MTTPEVPSQEDADTSVEFVSLHEAIEDTPPNAGMMIIERIEALTQCGVEERDATYIASHESITRAGGSLFPREQSKLDVLREKYRTILEQMDAPSPQRAISEYVRRDRLIQCGVSRKDADFVAEAETILKQGSTLSKAQRARLDHCYEQYREQVKNADITEDETLRQLLGHVRDTSHRFWKKVDSDRWCGYYYREAFMVEYLLAVEKHVRPLTAAERTTLEMRKVKARAGYFSTYLQGSNCELDAGNILFMELQQSKGVTLTPEQEFLLRSYRVKYQSLIKHGGLTIGESTLNDLQHSIRSSAARC